MDLASTEVAGGFGGRFGCLLDCCSCEGPERAGSAVCK